MLAWRKTCALLRQISLVHAQNFCLPSQRPLQSTPSSLASPDEAVSWGKIKTDASSVKVSADATLIFPLLVAQTFAKLPRSGASSGTTAAAAAAAVGAASATAVSANSEQRK